MLYYGISNAERHDSIANSCVIPALSEVMDPKWTSERKPEIFGIKCTP